MVRYRFVSICAERVWESRRNFGGGCRSAASNRRHESPIKGWKLWANSRDEHTEKRAIQSESGRLMRIAYAPYVTPYAPYITRVMCVNARTRWLQKPSKPPMEANIAAYYDARFFSISHTTVFFPSGKSKLRVAVISHKNFENINFLIFDLKSSRIACYITDCNNNCLLFFVL